MPKNILKKGCYGGKGSIRTSGRRLTGDTVGDPLQGYSRTSHQSDESRSLNIVALLIVPFHRLGIINHLQDNHNG